MALKKITYNGSSKVIIRLCEVVNDLIDRGSGGHTIQNSSGTDMTARTNLQFTGASVSDDAVNDRTVVDVPTYSDATQSASGLMSASDKTKLDGIASGAEVNVQPDWNEADNTADDYIKNKPTIPTALADLSEDTTHRVVTDTEKSTWNGKVSDNPTFSEASTRANIASGESFATILGKIKKFFSDLKTVAFTGAYADLTGQPTIPTVNDATLTLTQGGSTLGTFTANASSNVTIDVPGGGGGGHTIIDPDGTSMTQRAGLAFSDAHISDDAVNDETVVEVVESISKASWDLLDETDAENNGLYEIDLGANTPILDADDVAYGAGTVKTALDALKTLVATIDDTTPASAGGSKSVSFPSGFTMNNSVIVTVLVKVGNYAFSSVGSASYISAYYKSDGTGITLALTNDAPSGATSKAVKIVLLKI